MAKILDIESIDSVALNHEQQRIILTLVQDLDWGSVHNVHYLLHDKIQFYRQNYVSGKLLEEYPAAANYSVCVCIEYRHAPANEDDEFLQRISKFLAASGMTFEARFAAAGPDG